MTDTPPPRRRVILTVKIYADDLALAARELHVLANDSAEWEDRPVEHGVVMIGGACSITTDVDITAPIGDEYVAALRAWRDKKQGR